MGDEKRCNNIVFVSSNVNSKSIIIVCIIVYLNTFSIVFNFIELNYTTKDLHIYGVNTNQKYSINNIIFYIIYKTGIMNLQI